MRPKTPPGRFSPFKLEITEVKIRGGGSRNPKNFDEGFSYRVRMKMCRSPPLQPAQVTIKPCRMLSITSNRPASGSPRSQFIHSACMLALLMTFFFKFLCPSRAKEKHALSQYRWRHMCWKCDLIAPVCRIHAGPEWQYDSNDPQKTRPAESTCPPVLRGQTLSGETTGARFIAFVALLCEGGCVPPGHRV